MQLRHLLSHDDQQLADFTFSPVRTAHVDITALSLSRQHSKTFTQAPPLGITELFHLHQNEAQIANVCRVREGKLEC